ncbi:MAG: hypothetical protein JHC98_00585 [Thermoleophilaceae bacterium]|nr:hypothetical protein [Thermoleophilaceae bacterium]
MRYRLTLIGLICAALVALPVAASAAVFQNNGARDGSAFTSIGPAQAEGTGGSGKYVWFVDRLAGEDILRGFDQADPTSTTELATIDGSDDVGPGRIGSISGIAFSSGQNLLFVADRSNNRIIVYPRSNDGTSGDPVNYSTALDVGSFYPGFDVDDPAGVAIDTHGGLYGYASVRNSTGQRGLIVFSQTPSGNSLGWVKFTYDPSEWNTVNGPGPLTVDPTNGNIYSAIDGLAKVRGYTANIDGLAGSFQSATPGDYVSLAVDSATNRLFAAKVDSVDIFSLKTYRLLGTTADPSLGTNASLAQLPGTNKFFLASTTTPFARDLVLNAAPTCTPSDAIDAVAGEPLSIIPNCTDADSSATLEFEVIGAPALGNAYASGDYASIDYYPGVESLGADELSYRVTTQNGRSVTYQQPINVIPPDTTPPDVTITAPTAEATLSSSPATLHYTVSDDRDLSPTCNLADEAQIPLDEGDNTITVSCEDDAGNSGQDSVSFTYVPPDTEAPNVTISEPVSGTVVDSSSITLAYSVTDNFSAEPSCDYGNGAVLPLDIGSNLITVHCTDGAGNVGEDSTVVTYDSDAPQIEIGAPLDGALVTAPAVTLSYSTSDDTDNDPACNLSDGATVPLSPGPNLIVVSCTDHGGHQAARSVTVSYDAAAPEISITAPTDGARTDIAQTVLRYSATDDVDSELECSRADGATIALVEGTNTITVTCTDDAERVSSASVAVTYAPTQVESLGTPFIRKSANLEPATGDVFVKLPGSDKYIPLSEALLVPVGTIVDARKGTAKLTLANADGTTYEAEFWGGIFQVFQGTGDQPLAIMKLRDDLIDTTTSAASAYPRFAANPFKAIQIAKRGKKKNGLWGNGKGKFRTSGSGGSATVRGTKWYVANYENGTYFRVDRGIVNVRPTHGNCFDLKAGETRFVEYKPLTESQRLKKLNKKKSKPKKGCL